MRRILLAVIGLVTAAALVGCSSSSNSGSDTNGSSSSSTAPEDITTSDKVVAAGLKSLKALAAQISQKAADNIDDVKQLATGLEPIWQPIEGTIKQKDADTYLKIEDAFANIESGNAGKATQGAADLAAAADAYLAKYPG